MIINPPTGLVNKNIEDKLNDPLLPQATDQLDILINDPKLSKTAKFF